MTIPQYDKLMREVDDLKLRLDNIEARPIYPMAPVWPRQPVSPWTAADYTMAHAFGGLR